MSGMGMTTPVIASAVSRYICTAFLIPTERKTRAAGNKRNLCKSASCILYDCHPKIPNTQLVASFSAGKNLILFSVLESSAHWLQYRKFSVITCAYTYRWDVDICYEIDQEIVKPSPKCCSVLAIK